jgi:hypothetical protein
MYSPPPPIEGRYYRQFCAYLRPLLPPPPENTEEARASRDQLAMDAVVALYPVDEHEAFLAMRVVAMGIHADDALRLAVLATDPMVQYRCRAQAASMARQADTLLRTLLRIQDKRDKQIAQKHPAAMERAGYWFRPISVPEPEPEPPPPPPPPPPSEEPDEDGQPVLTQAQIDAETDLYAAMYPDRVKRILAAGGLPRDLDFGPPDDVIVATLLRRNGGMNGTGTPSLPSPAARERDVGTSASAFAPLPRSGGR